MGGGWYEPDLTAALSSEWSKTLSLKHPNINSGVSLTQKRFLIKYI